MCSFPDAAPIRNMVLPNNMFVMYHAATPIPIPALGPAVTPTNPHTPTTSNLIPSHLHPGPHIQINEFCNLHCLREKIVYQLIENGFTGTQAFCFIETKDLKDMGFKPGEIADLKDVIKAWAIVSLTVAFFNHFFSHFLFHFSEKIRSEMRAKWAFSRKMAIMLVFGGQPVFLLIFDLHFSCAFKLQLSKHVCKVTNMMSHITTTLPSQSP